MEENELKQIYGRNIKRIREERKMTQDALSEKIGLNEKYLSTIETGAKWGSFDTLILLANALNVEPYELLLPNGKEVSIDSKKTKELMLRFRTNLNELVDTVEEFLKV
ncbi:MAG: helix-turn-helix domain-containing protein [Treponema sp.]|nr:helix-turn-helix domain-containing protein [Treponema sp.]